MRVTPFKVCRDYTRLAPVSSPRAQDCHWLRSVNPLEVASVDLTGDEALWAMLWTQGVSKEGGARTKSYHYGSKIAGTLYNLFTLTSGLEGAAVASDILKQQLIEQATAARMHSEIAKRSPQADASPGHGRHANDRRQPGRSVGRGVDRLHRV